MASSIWPKTPAPFVRTVLSGHSALGLIVGGLAYLLSLTGVLAVFLHDFERWEQPNAPEFQAFAPGALDRLYGEVLAAADGPVERIFLTLPSAEQPRSAVYFSEQAWFATPDGRLGEAVNHEWTHLLEHLHYYLTLPTSFGMIVVSLVGAAMVGLIVSGLLAHPRIFRDAFTFRWSGSPRLSQADLHNRLSVWAAPFHIAIALTGAYFGLAGLILMLAGAGLTEAERERLTAPLFGQPPAADAAAAPPPKLDAILDATATIAPQAELTYLSIVAPGTEGQAVDVSGTVAGQLVYSETWRFDGAGEFVSRLGTTDGALGQQVAWAVYPLHFGSFGGLPIRLAYGVLGLALCVVVASGVNIWLVRRRAQGRAAPRLERLWITTVWGPGLGLALSAAAMLAVAVPAEPVFWGSFGLMLAAAPLVSDARRLSRVLRLATAAAILLVLCVHAVRFGAEALGPAAWAVNLCLLLTAAGLAASALPLTRPQSRLNPQSAPIAGE
ncbi:MAG: PepSY domain-containing protein [Caulobacteraceae bacterium]|nr:PepSY domain-containing protein [Caulobacteraceae bacterium]